MKFLCTVKSVESFSDIKNLCDGIVMTNANFSSRYDSSLSN